MGFIPPAKRQLEIIHGKCQLCQTGIGLDNFHADHKIPIELGGKTIVSNGQATCGSCNSSKGAKSTKGYKWKIIYKKRFLSKSKALSFEYKLKKDRKKRLSILKEVK